MVKKLTHTTKILVTKRKRKEKNVAKKDDFLEVRVQRTRHRIRDKRVEISR